jgi:hypothetical protein
MLYIKQFNNLIKIKKIREIIKISLTKIINQGKKILWVKEYFIIDR